MENETKAPEEVNTTTENNNTTPIAEKETQEQINWKKFREVREVERKQKLESDKRAAEKEAEAVALKAAMDALLNKQAPVHASSNDYSDSTEEDEATKVRRLVREELEKEKQLNDQERQKREQQEFPRKLEQSFTDFNQVCNTENLDYLEYHYPEVADAFKTLPDGYDKWSKIYKAVKRFVPNTNSKNDAIKAEKNFNKPQAMSIPGKTQVGDTAPVNLDDKRRADNWQRMQRIMRGG